jgi:hypothetical protein
VISNPTTCRIVLYHFAIRGDDHKLVSMSRPAIVTSIGPSDDVVNLFVFWEPDDNPSGCPYRTPAQHQACVHPFNPASPQTPGWSWPPRS